MIAAIDTPAGGSGPSLTKQVEEIFSPSGILSKARNFEYRPEQQQMAVAVARALENREHLVAEAGTGVGKSLAYLVPAILFALANKKKAIVSTHTINLQEQLIEKDLPMLRKVLPQHFTFGMLKGRANYLCTRRLLRARQQAASLFTSSETEELKRIYEWSQKTEDGSLSDFDVEPDSKVWEQVCSERGLCSPRGCGPGSDFAKDHQPCFYQRVRQRMLGCDVLVLNHTLFFTLLGAGDEENKGGILFKNDFVVFDEAHTVEHVASKHIGLGVSRGQLHWAAQKLWNPRTQKGLLAALGNPATAKLVSDLLSHGDEFFGNVESACEEIQEAVNRRSFGRGEAALRKRDWSELRIRRSDFVEDTVSLPLQRLRESISELIQTSDDKETGEELLECNRRLEELRDGVASFLSQNLEQHVYWVERSGKTQRNISLNAAPVDVADFLRRRLFGSDTSVIMTSATLSVRTAAPGSQEQPASGERPAACSSPMEYFSHRVGAESATLLQVGTPFDYQRQMKLFVVRKMTDPKEEGYRDALIHWIEHFI